MAAPLWCRRTTPNLFSQGGRRHDTTNTVVPGTRTGRHADVAVGRGVWPGPNHRTLVRRRTPEERACCGPLLAGGAYTPRRNESWSPGHADGTARGRGRGRGVWPGRSWARRAVALAADAETCVESVVAVAAAVAVAVAVAVPSVWGPLIFFSFHFHFVCRIEPVIDRYGREPFYRPRMEPLTPDMEGVTALGMFRRRGPDTPQRPKRRRTWDPLASSVYLCSSPPPSSAACPE